MKIWLLFKWLKKNIYINFNNQLDDSYNCQNGFKRIIKLKNIQDIKIIYK